MKQPAFTIRDVTKKSERERVLAIFTQRELEVWRRIASGQTTKEIAADLGVCYKTVDHFRESIYNKCVEARNVADLTRAAVRYGIITVELAA